MFSLNPVNWFQSAEYDSSSTGNAYSPGGVPTRKPNTLTDWIARNEFTDAEYEAELNDLAALDRERIAQQVADGKITKVQGGYNTALANQIGTPTYDANLGKKGLPALALAMPWWVWAIVVSVAIYFFVTLGGLQFVRRLTKK